MRTKYSAIGTDKASLFRRGAAILIGIGMLGVTGCSDLGDADALAKKSKTPTIVVGSADPYLSLTHLDKRGAVGRLDLSYADEAARGYSLLPGQEGMALHLISTTGGPGCGFKACAYTEKFEIWMDHDTLVQAESEGIKFRLQASLNRRDVASIDRADVELAARRALMDLGPGFGAPYK